MLRTDLQQITVGRQELLLVCRDAKNLGFRGHTKALTVTLEQDGDP
jgi:hypothetical protein